MTRYRSLAGILMLALTLGFVALGSNAASSANGYRAVVPHYAVGASRIHGVVQDQSGKRLDDVEVVATGDGSASQLTYADSNGSGHGFFNLAVFRGTYTVKFIKDGYSTITVEDVSVGRRKTVDLGTIKLIKKVTKTETSGTLVDDVVTRREKGKVKVTVSPGKSKPVGEVLVKEGRDTVGDADLTGSDRGEIIVTLERLAPGSHTLKVVYKGTKLFEGSSSKTFTLTVKRR